MLRSPSRRFIPSSLVHRAVAILALGAAAWLPSRTSSAAPEDEEKLSFPKIVRLECKGGAIATADISTGIGVAPGTADPFWKILSAPGTPSGAQSAYATAFSGSNPWVVPTPAHKWIQRRASATPVADDPSGAEYVYRLPIFVGNVMNPTMTFRFSADNGATVRLLSGTNLTVVTPVTPLPATCSYPYFHTCWHQVNNQPAVQGLNVLEISVRNQPGPGGGDEEGQQLAKVTAGGSSTYTGLVVEGTIRGECLCPDLRYDLGSGYANATNGSIAVGQADDGWTVVSPTTGPAIVGDTTTGGNWTAPFPGTSWISLNATKGAGGPPKTTIYQHCFCLDKYFKNPQLTLTLRADDMVGVVRLNNNPIFAGQGVGPTPPFPLTVSTNNAAFFLPGRNCITIEVKDTAKVITGLNVAGFVSASNGQCCRRDAALPRDGRSPTDER